MMTPRHEFCRTGKKQAGIRWIAMQLRHRTQAGHLKSGLPPLIGASQCGTRTHRRTLTGLDPLIYWTSRTEATAPMLC